MKTTSMGELKRTPASLREELREKDAKIDRLRAERDDALAAAEIHAEEHRKVRMEERRMSTKLNQKFKKMNELLETGSRIKLARRVVEAQAERDEWERKWHEAMERGDEAFAKRDRAEVERDEARERLTDLQEDLADAQADVAKAKTLHEQACEALGVDYDTHLATMIRHDIRLVESGRADSTIGRLSARVAELEETLREIRNGYCADTCSHALNRLYDCDCHRAIARRAWNE